MKTPNRGDWLKLELQTTDTVSAKYLNETIAEKEALEEKLRVATNVLSVLDTYLDNCNAVLKRSGHHESIKQALELITKEIP